LRTSSGTAGSGFPSLSSPAHSGFKRTLYWRASTGNSAGAVFESSVAATGGQAFRLASSPPGCLTDFHYLSREASVAW